MSDLDDLEAKARAATQGPWFLGYRAVCSEPLSREYQRIENTFPEHIADDDPRWDSLPDYDVCAVPVVAGDTPTPQGAKDGSFIAAASPDVILALIARVRVLEAGLKEALDGWDKNRPPNPYDKGQRARIAELRKLQGDHE